MYMVQLAIEATSQAPIAPREKNGIEKSRAFFDSNQTTKRAASSPPIVITKGKCQVCS